MFKKLTTLIILANLLTGSYVLAGTECEKRAKDNKLILEGKEKCCCRLTTEAPSNKYECEPVLSDTGNCPEERKTKITIQERDENKALTGKFLCPCTFTKG